MIEIEEKALQAGKFSDFLMGCRKFELRSKKENIEMKRQNAVRNLLMIALLVGGFFAVGMENRAYGSGYILSVTRTGYISATGRAESSTTSTATDSTRSGYLISTGRAESSTTQQSNEAETESFLDYILSFFP